MNTSCSRWLRVLVLTTALIAIARPASAQLSLGIGDLFPDFSALDQDNVPFRLSDYRGRVVLLHICTTWCTPCRMSAEEEELLIEAIDAAVGADKWVLVDALYQDSSLGPTGQADAVRWRQQLDTPARTLHGSDDPNSELYLLPDVIGLDAIPTYVVIAPDGRVSAIQVGYEIGFRWGTGTGAVLMQHVIDAIPASPDAIIEDLLEEIGQASAAGGAVNGLAAILRQALATLTDDNTSNDAAAAGGLAAFINQVQAQAGKKIPADMAADWIAAAQSALDAIGGT